MQIGWNDLLASKPGSKSPLNYDYEFTLTQYPNSGNRTDQPSKKDQPQFPNTPPLVGHGAAFHRQE
jgi:hypothetical protein